MRSLLLLALFVVAVGGLMEPFGAPSRAEMGEGCDPAVDPDCFTQRITVPGVTRAQGDALPMLFVDAGCTVALGHFYTLVGYEVVSVPENFFYTHAHTHYYGEPFTHTGALAGLLNGPGGPYAANAVFQDRQAVFEFGQVQGPGGYTFSLPGDPITIYNPSSTTAFTVPQDCDLYLPLADSLLHSLEQSAAERVELHGTAQVTNGTCPPYQTPLTFTIRPDGSADSFQPDTLDFNQGHVWPGPLNPVVAVFPEVGEDWLNLFVHNPAHPEAYMGALSPDLKQIVGRVAWKECVWDFVFEIDAILTY